MGNGYTHLFFLDEAVALAAGHRPCAQCRREAYKQFQDAWIVGSHSRPTASVIDKSMHRARVAPSSGTQKRHLGSLDELPDGAFVFIPHTRDPALVCGKFLLPCFPDGYGKPLERPRRIKAIVLTPTCTLAVLMAGYRPILHHTATDWLLSNDGQLPPTARYEGR